MQSHGSVIDMRFEVLYESQREAPFRDSPDLSINARKMFEAFHTPKWLEREELVRKIDSGYAEETEKEVGFLYDSMPEMMGEIIDLFNMVSRRDEEIARLNREIEAMSEAAAGASL